MNNDERHLGGMEECHKLPWSQKTTIFVYINPFTKLCAINQLTLIIVGPIGGAATPPPPPPPPPPPATSTVWYLPADKAIIEIKEET